MNLATHFNEVVMNKSAVNVKKENLLFPFSKVIILSMNFQNMTLDFNIHI